MKLRHLIYTAHKSIADVSIPRQAKSIAIRLDSNEQAVKIVQSLDTIGYTVSAGQVAGHPVSLLIGKRAA